MAGVRFIRRILAFLPRWWSQHLFRGLPSAQLNRGSQHSAVLRTAAKRFMVLALAGGLLLLMRLSCPLLEPEEARYAEIPRQMLAQGSFIEPVWHGQPYYHKPPLLYWLVMLSYSLLGVHDWAARLVPALASLATVFVTWTWGTRALGARAGFLAALVLCLSARFVYLGRMLTIDPLLCLWVTAALAAAHLAMREAPLRWHWWLTSAVLTGLGLLTKGPVALVLTLAPVLAFQWLDRRTARPSFPRVAAYVALAIGITCPWYLAMCVTNPAAAVDFLWLHNIQRYLDPLDHHEPFWFFLPGLLLGTLPWSLLLWPLGRWLLGYSRGTGAPPPALGFCLLALLWCVGFFSLSGCKRAVYILPALPWLALCLGACLDARPWLRLGWQETPKLWKFGAAVVFVLLLLGVHEWLPGYHRHFALRGQIRRHAEADRAAFCYPKRWDSVTFYLQRDDVRVFTAQERAALIAELRALPEAMLFVKTRALPELLAELPPSLEFVPVGRQGPTLTVGLVRAGKGTGLERGQAPFAGTALRVLRTKGACPLSSPGASHKRCLSPFQQAAGSLIFPSAPIPELKTPPAR
jgi:hypothetical protein